MFIFRLSYLVLVTICLLSSCMQASLVNEPRGFTPLDLGITVKSISHDTAYILKVNVGTDDAFGELNDEQRKEIAPGCYEYALDEFPGWGEFPSNFNPHAEFPSGYVSVSEAFLSLEDWLMTWSSGLFVGRHLETVYYWCGGREYCVQFFEITEEGAVWNYDYILPDSSTLPIPIRIGVFKKLSIY